MIPIALLGSTVYLVGRVGVVLPVTSRLSYPQGLQLARAKLSHEKQVTEAQERVAQLEARLEHLESEAGNASVERVAPEGSPTKKSWWW